MKIRNGFVSNSSSSSFIIGICKIDNETVFKDNVNTSNVTYKYVCEYNSQYATVDSFDGCSVSLDLSKYNPGDLIAEFDYYGCEGDYAFLIDEDDWDIDYNIVYDDNFFDEREQKIMDIFTNNKYASDGEVCIGAGRNG